MDKSLQRMIKFYSGVGILGVLSYGLFKTYKMTKDSSYWDFYWRNIFEWIDKMKTSKNKSFLMTQILKSWLFPNEEIDSS